MSVDAVGYISNELELTNKGSGSNFCACHKYYVEPAMQNSTPTTRFLSKYNEDSAS